MNIVIVMVCKRWNNENKLAESRFGQGVTNENEIQAKESIDVRNNSYLVCHCDISCVVAISRKSQVLTMKT